ncbi:zinc finger CCCH domain-containing protein 48-like [Curcuma longa]|uniref:zinc finger CCCH domain-containing protein 48-like n=1 Tax=Curcuma longa TaxID=136217 RepID=UPI003D9F58B4
MRGVSSHNSVKYTNSSSSWGAKSAAAMFMSMPVFKMSCLSELFGLLVAQANYISSDKPFLKSFSLFPFSLLLASPSSAIPETEKIAFVRRGIKRVYQRPTSSSRATAPPHLRVCCYWRAGRCNRYPCRFLHGELADAPSPVAAEITKRRPAPTNFNTSGPPSVSGKRRDASPPVVAKKNDNAADAPPPVAATFKKRRLDWTNPNTSDPHAELRRRRDARPPVAKTNDNAAEAPPPVAATITNQSLVWTNPNTSDSPAELKKPRDASPPVEKTNDDKIRGQFFAGNSTCGGVFSHLASLRGHKNAVSGVTLPDDSDMLFSGGKDERLRIWDCHTGQLLASFKMGGGVGSVISEGPWIFVGVPNSIKVWNTEIGTQTCLDGPNGQVHSLAVANGLLFAGIQDGSILAWKIDSENNSLEPTAALVGHKLAVTSFMVGDMLYSASMDHTIKVWNLATLECVQTVTEHKSAVLSLLRYDKFLISCSLDNTIKIWTTTKGGNLEIVYSHQEDHGPVCLRGIQGTPILLSSCSDSSIRTYELPSFTDRGHISCKEEIDSIQVSLGGYLYIGHVTGVLDVWKFETASI